MSTSSGQALNSVKDAEFRMGARPLHTVRLFVLKIRVHPRESAVKTNHWLESQPNENRKAAQTSFIRAGLSWATRFPNRC